MDNPPDDGPCEVTITAPDRAWLQAFAHQIVEHRLAAAAHIDTMQTTYRWDGEVRENHEARLRLHTVFERLDQIKSRVRELHPYEVPCVIATAIDNGEHSYLQWITKESH